MSVLVSTCQVRCHPSRKLNISLRRNELIDVVLPASHVDILGSESFTRWLIGTR